MNVLPLQSINDHDWLELRATLWPHASASEHIEEMSRFMGEPHRFGQFIARDEQGVAWGFIEASIRHDYVNGTDSSPVGFLEGLYVKPRGRRQGVASALVQVAMQWAKSGGCSELASDASIKNRKSQAMHKSLGFVETERVVYFNKRLE